MKIGFIGQGWIGKNYADNFEERGFDVVRYSLEEPYIKNKDLIKKCKYVFIAVPTPTVKSKVDLKAIDSSLKILKPGSVAIIKSTILPGTTKKLQNKFKDIKVLHSPEFLSKATAREDTDKPSRNIIGIPLDDRTYKVVAKNILKILPKAPFETITSSDASELIKYVNNTFFYTKVIYMNYLYDIAEKLGVDWEDVKLASAAEPMIGPYHIDPVHKTGRGAGGICLLKDFEALKCFGDSLLNDEKYKKLTDALIEKNLDLLVRTCKDIDCIAEIYGEEVVNSYTKNRRKR